MATLPFPAVDRAAALLDEAIERRASDLHLDPGPSGVAVRFRVDGRFLPRDPLGREEGERLVGRLKVLAGLMVYRTDVPQEGRLPLPGGREGRLALIPTPHGEKAVVRLFDPQQELLGLDDLEFDARTLAALRRFASLDQGLVTIVGPSGAGKTTTLYALVRDVVRRRGEFAQVVTVEDPIERHLDGCVQVQVDPVRDLDFAGALKFLLRQDPEVVMIGEVRDLETARIAVRAALTGHLVLASMHCGRAGEARGRLLEMGVEPWALDLAFAGAVAQRLVRKRCGDCGGDGCDSCLSSGFRGRLPIVERADRTGTVEPDATLEASGGALVAAGRTTAAELDRVLGRMP